MKRALALAVIACIALSLFADEKKTSATDPLAERRLPKETPEGKLLGQAGTWLLGQMKDDAGAARKGQVRGAWWTQIDEHPFTTDSLYSGSAGTVLAMMTLAEATGDERFAVAARRGVRHLLDAAVKDGGGLTWEIAWDDKEEKVHTSRYSGLYSGVAGIAWVLLTYGDAFGDAEASAAGRGGFDWVCAQAKAAPGGPKGKFWDEGELDIIAGNAGIVLALLDAHRMTGEARYRRAAVEGAESLLAAAEKSAEGWAWKSALGWDRIYTGFSHGVAGMAGTMARVYAATGDERFLEAARQGARWLEKKEICVSDGNGTSWRHDTTSKPEDMTWEGWCHGPSGTCRLHLLLHSLTGEAKYLDVAEAGAKYLLAKTDPAKDRAEAGFYAPSLCCGAAGAGSFMVELYRYTGKKEYLDYASKVTGFLDRIATRPRPDQACWSLSGRPEGKSGKLWHGTNLMTGQGGYVTFLAQLATQKERVVREVFVPPDFAAVGAPPGRRMVVVEYGKGSERFHASVRRLASYRGCEWERLAEGDRVEPLRDLARRQQADSIAIAVAPGVLDFNLNRRVLEAVSTIDEDVFPDAAFGFLTGAKPEHVRAMLDRMAEVEHDGMRPREVSYGVAEVDDVSVYPPGPAEDGLTLTDVYIPTHERYAKVRSKLPEALAQARGAGFVHFSGNGDPMRIWLFDDQRNAKPELHWKFDPKKICRNWADKDLTSLGSTEFANWEIAGAMMQFTTCHSGVTGRAIVESDIVATFGSTGHVARFYDLTPEESLCLNLLSRAPCALLAPIGPNHGALGIPEKDRLHWENLPAGEAIRRGHIDVALHWRTEGRVPMVQFVEGKPDPSPNDIAGNIMREGTLNRVLFGDPTFRPFEAVSPRKGSLQVERVKTASNGGAATFSVTVLRPTTFEYWNPYAGDGQRGERLVVGIPFQGGELGVSKVSLSTAVKPAPAITKASWTLESRRGQAPMLWIMLEAPDTGDYDKKEMWRKDAVYTVDVEFAETSETTGDVRLSK
ncbi:MAG: hypothetical protein HYY18_05125 [Planctomycetes bacterium]|nr:hypothetical protein [Planctomycetota bacterium]